MLQQYDDLLTLFSEARRGVPDSRLIWAVAADGFDTTLSHRQGLILGGSWSPHFLRDHSTNWWDTPWTVNLRNPSIVRIERAVASVSEWIPLMETVAQAGESLLIVTKEIGSEMLRTLVVNSSKGTLACCAVRAAEDLPLSLQSSLNTSWDFVDTVPKTTRQLPKASEAWSRRNATVLFPSNESEWRSYVNDITIISVGGKNQEDQHNRLRFIIETMQDES